MLGGRIDHHIGPQFQRFLEDRGGKDIVHHDLGARSLGQLGDGGNIGDFQQGIGWGLDQEHLGIGPDRIFPGLEVGGIDHGGLNAKPRQPFGDNPAARAKQGPACDQVITGP